jgi:hypothetical protein
MNFNEFFKTRQQALVLVVGYVMVTGLAFGLGRISASSHQAPEIRVEQAFAPLNDTPDIKPNQSSSLDSSNTPAPGPAPAQSAADCAAGQIKGNIGASGSKVYHMPGGSFYNRTKAEACFATEAEAQAAGFRKSSS